MQMFSKYRKCRTLSFLFKNIMHTIHKKFEKPLDKQCVMVYNRIKKRKRTRNTRRAET